MAWNGSNGASAPQVTPRKSPASPWRGAVALLIIVALGGAAYFLVSRDAPKPTKPVEKAERKTIAEVKPAEVVKKTEESSRASEVTNKPLGTIFRAHTGKDGQIVTLMDGTVVTNYPPKPIFRRDLERTLQVALRPGGMSRALIDVLLARHSEHEIEQMLKEMTIPEPDDPENVKRIKNEVQSLKERILEEIQSGRSVAEVFDEIKRVGMRENYLRVQAMKMRAEAIREGDVGDIRDAVNAGNQLLEQHGLPSMSMPEQARGSE